MKGMCPLSHDDGTHMRYSETLDKFWNARVLYIILHLPDVLCLLTLRIISQ